MPLMRVDVIKGHDEAYLKKVLDIAYEVQCDKLGTPRGDRYQVLTQHEPFELQVGDTGLGFNRSKNVIVFNIVLRPKPTKAKKAFYEELVHRLNQELNISKEDVMVSLVVNNDDDWSFGNGRPQFINGDL